MKNKNYFKPYGMMFKKYYCSKCETLLEKEKTSLCDDIFELYNELLEETDYRLRIELSRNDLAWFAYEENAIKIYNDIF